MPESISSLEGLSKIFASELVNLPWEERLRKITANRTRHVVFSTSFSLEDQAITHAIAKFDLPVRIFTIDTGRLFGETYDTFQKTQETYFSLSIETFFPNTNSLEKLVSKNGINGFYNSVENRESCCFVRKVEPLNRALDGAELWISGLRREHSSSRESLPVAEYDVGRNIIKIYPLIDVAEEEIKAYIQANGIPYNPLHDQGFPSIGCAPCTRAIQPGENARAGRWWWEQKNEQECGLHIKDGKLVRIKQAAHA